MFSLTEKKKHTTQKFPRGSTPVNCEGKKKKIIHSARGKQDVKTQVTIKTAGHKNVILFSFLFKQK